MDEIERARMAMGGARSGALPVEAVEPVKQNDGLTDEERAELSQARHPKQPIASVGNFNTDGDAIEMSVDDFLAATKREHYVSKLWKSKTAF